ncbi:MAG: response regulator [Pararhodobacter sp.]|nr:response regulator [Pararhodobacter sp.]
MPPTGHATATNSPPAPPAGLLAQPGHTRPQTVLLVEDSRFAAEAVRLMCRRTGLRLRRADTLTAAWQHLRVYRPDIALIDLGLPDGSGLELIDALNRTMPRIGRIIAITGDSVLEQAARRAGADDFVEKPLSLSLHLTRLLGVPVDLGDTLEHINQALGLEREPPQTGAAQTTYADNTAHPPRPGTRNMGADPLALRDDLARAHDLLAHDPGPARIGYAAQFLAGIAHSLDDQPLLAMAERVRASGEAAPLVALLRQRVATSAPF